MAPRLGLGGGVTANPASGLFASTPLLLDTYPNAHRAYSMRKLRTEYTGYAMKVREGSGMNYTADVAFDDDGRVSASSKIYNPSGGGSDGDTIATFVSSNDGFATIWYDQSGEGSNATQPTATKQPKLFSSGTLETSGAGQVASLKFDGSNDHLIVDEAGLTLRDITTFYCAEADSDWDDSPPTGNVRVPFALSISYPSLYYAVLLRADLNTYEYWYGAYPASGATLHAESVAEEPHIVTLTGGSGTDKQILYVDQTASSVKGDSTLTTTLQDSANNGIGAWGASYSWKGDIQEFIIYDSDVSANRANIEDDMNAVYGAYS